MAIRYEEVVSDYVKAVKPYISPRDKALRGVFDTRIYPYSGLLLIGCLYFITTEHRDIQRGRWKDRIYFIDLGRNAFTGSDQEIPILMAHTQGLIAGMTPPVPLDLGFDPGERRAAEDFRRWLKERRYE